MARMKAGVIEGRKLNHKQQTRLAGSISYYWLNRVRYENAKFPPPADTTPMVRCRADVKNCAGVYPTQYVVLRAGQCECEECSLARQERDLRRLAREEMLTDEQMEEQRDIARRRRKGLPTTSSPSAIAHMHLADARVRLMEMKLPTENADHLAEQVERYRALMPTVNEAVALELTFGETAISSE